MDEIKREHDLLMRIYEDEGEDNMSTNLKKLYLRLKIKLLKQEVELSEDIHYKFKIILQIYVYEHQLSLLS